MPGWDCRTGLLFAAVGGLALSAHAVLPPPERVAGAIAEANRAAGRVVPLRIEVELRLERGPARSGVLVSYPARAARLELRDAAGSVEHHLLQGTRYTMTRDGLPQQDFHRLLPPLFLLQADSGALLRAQLEDLGVDAEALRLGRLEDSDCYVLGGRGGAEEIGSARPLVSLWSDAWTHEMLRVLTREGVEYRLGPVTLFESLRLPAWIEILEPGGFRARLELRDAAPAPAGAPPPGAETGPASQIPPWPPRRGAEDRATGE